MRKVLLAEQRDLSLPAARRAVLRRFRKLVFSPLDRSVTTPNSLSSIDSYLEHLLLSIQLLKKRSIDKIDIFSDMS